MSNLEESPKPASDSPQQEDASETNDEAKFEDSTSPELVPNEATVSATSVTTNEVKTEPGTAVFADSTNPENFMNQPVKKRDFGRSTTIMAIITFSLLVLTILVGGAMAFTAAAQENSNHAVIIDKMKVDGANVVGDRVSEGATGDYLLLEMEDQFIKCDVMVVNNETPVGLVFCQPGAPAVFSVPVPNDPDNIFTSMFNKVEQ